MTWSAALPGAALRVLRTAAGRRALQVVVLVGGLFALGFLCGERANAAEGLPTTTSAVVTPVTPVTPAVTSVVTSVATPLTASLPDPADSTVEDKVLRPVTEPVADLVETVTDELAELPGLPESPEPPVVPVVPVLPGQTLPAPVAETPRPDSPAHGSTAGHASGKAGKASEAAEASEDSEAAEAAPAVVGPYGPSAVAGSPAAGTSARADVHRVAAPTGYAPVRQAPAGDQGWALGHRPGADNGSSRHGDAQAVSLDDRAPLRLLPGRGIARTDAYGTRDRHRDIPVSPA